MSYILKLNLPVPHLQVGVHYELSEEEKFYRNALTRMPDGPAALEEAYNAVEDIVSEVEQYVKVGAINKTFAFTTFPPIEVCWRNRVKLKVRFMLFFFFMINK